MSKKRKTRKEKIIADLRRQLSRTKSFQSPSLESSKPVQKDGQIKEILPVPQKDYGYVFSDMKKTIGVVLAIFMVNFVIFFALEKHIIHIRFLGL